MLKNRLNITNESEWSKNWFVTQKRKRTMKAIKLELLKRTVDSLINFFIKPGSADYWKKVINRPTLVLTPNPKGMSCVLPFMKVKYHNAKAFSTHVYRIINWISRFHVKKKTPEYFCRFSIFLNKILSFENFYFHFENFNTSTNNLCPSCQAATAIKLLLHCMLLTSEDFFLTLYWAHWFRPEHFQSLHHGPDLVSTRNRVSAEEIYDVILRTRDEGDPVACSCARSYTLWNWLQNHNNTAVVGACLSLQKAN